MHYRMGPKDDPPLPITTISYSVSFINATRVGLSRQDGPRAVLTAGDGLRRIRLARGGAAMNTRTVGGDRHGDARAATRACR